VKGSLFKASQFRSCKVDGPITEGVLLICIWILVWVSLEKVDTFCYLGDMLDADGMCNSALVARARTYPF